MRLSTASRTKPGFTALTTPKAARKLPRWTREEIGQRLANLWKQIRSADVPAARLLLSKIFGPIRVTLAGTKKEKAWNLAFHADVLNLLIPNVRFSSECGSGGGI